MPFATPLLHAFPFTLYRSEFNYDATIFSKSQQPNPTRNIKALDPHCATPPSSTKTQATLLKKQREILDSNSTSSRLLALPLEIRLQIYSCVIALHPAYHVHLAPPPVFQQASGTSTANSNSLIHSISTTFALNFPGFETSGKSTPGPFPALSTLDGNYTYSSFRYNSEYGYTSSSFSSSASRKSEKPRIRLGAEPRGCGYVPTALLVSCKQIYAEARPIPWRDNEFTFINWFASGVYASRTFLKGLAQWQRNEMRWARIEVLGRDLSDAFVVTTMGWGAGAGEWKELCGLWSGDEAGEGVRGLRLAIKERIDLGQLAEPASDGSTVPREWFTDVLTGLHENHTNETVARMSVLDPKAEWVTGGLMQMKALRWLELDIEDASVDRQIKIDFCAAIARELSEGLNKNVEVVLVEKVVPQKVVVEEEEEEEEDPAWGEPVDIFGSGADS